MSLHMLGWVVTAVLVLLDLFAQFKLGTEIGVLVAAGTELVGG
jgi:hypothetical protein